MDRNRQRMFRVGPVQLQPLSSETEDGRFVVNTYSFMSGVRIFANVEFYAIKLKLLEIGGKPLFVIRYMNCNPLNRTFL